MIAEHDGKIVGVGGSLVNFVTGKGPVSTSVPVVDPLPAAKYLTYFDMSGFETSGTCTDQPEINTYYPDYPLTTDDWYVTSYGQSYWRGATVMTIDDGSDLDGCKMLVAKRDSSHGGGDSSLLQCTNIAADRVYYDTGTESVRVYMHGKGKYPSVGQYETRGKVYLSSLTFEFKLYRGTESESYAYHGEIWFNLNDSLTEYLRVFNGATIDGTTVKYNNRDAYDRWVILSTTVDGGFRRVYIDGKLIAETKYSDSKSPVYKSIYGKFRIQAPETEAGWGNTSAMATEYYISEEDLSKGHHLTLNWPSEPLIKP
jgi:hypothetical protein